MLVQLLRRFPLTRRWVFRFAEGRASYFVENLLPFLDKKWSVLDIGVGTGNITARLRAAGYTVAALDVEDLSFVPNLRPTLFDGKTLPFDDDSFDAALIITVLHHTQNPERLIREARRVARVIIIVEDVHKTKLHKLTTMFIDSLLNLEFFGHPHSNHTDFEWQSTFTKLHLKLMSTADMHSFVVMRHKLYVLERA